MFGALTLAVATSANSGFFDRFIGHQLTKQEIAQILGRRLTSDSVSAVTETIKTAATELQVQYSIDRDLQEAIERTLQKSKVMFGAFVAMDVKTGKVLAMVSHGMRNENLALRATFPAASIFKIVTASAALESGKLQRTSLIPVRGSYHTLYKQNVLKGGGIEPEPDQMGRYMRMITLEDALAKSVNSVFGKVGIFGVGPEGLRKTASAFQFGRAIPFEMPVDISQAMVPNDEFGLAESASGFTRLNTMSPLHGALIAAAVANGGTMMEPSIVSRVTDAKGKIQYEMQPRQLATVLDKATAEQVELMMHRTIINGTSRRAFRGSQRNPALAEAFIGGKTGSLNGWNPAGRYDWFVGFGEQAEAKVAVAALCIHGYYRGMKASQVARKALEAYFRPMVAAVSPLRRE